MLRRPLATETNEDFSEPILPGKGASDYERYLRTDELLALQKTPEEQVHPDELLFQTVHQSSELWLKLGTSEVARATVHVRAGELAAALRLLDRAALCLQFITRRVTPPLGEAFEAAVAQEGLDLVEVYVQGRDHEELYQLAEALVEWDERITMWRIRHYKVVARIIGDQVVGTQGTPVEVLGKMIHHNFFPALWRARNQLTARANDEEG